MSVRILSAQAKATYLSVGLIVVVGLPVIITIPLGLVPGMISYFLLMTAWVIIGTRTFRGENEAVQEPRAWWRMTSKPTAGVVLALLLLLHAGGAATQLGQPSTELLGFAIAFDVVLAALYLGSSLGLRRIAR